MSLPPTHRESLVDGFGRLLAALILMLTLCLLGVVGAAVVTIALA